MSSKRPQLDREKVLASALAVADREGIERLTVRMLATELDRLDLIDEYRFLLQPRIAGHGPTLYQRGLPGTRRLELVSSTPLRNGTIALHYRRVRD